MSQSGQAGLILDASAIVAFLLDEPGQEIVAEAILDGALACTANLAEVMTLLVRGGMSMADAGQVITELPIGRVNLDLDLALNAGALVVHTKPFGLSLGDRICLALAAREGLPALTGDREWTNVAPLIGISVRLIR